MTELPDFHGPHIGSPLPDAEAVDWSEQVPRFTRVRVLRHTCECKPYVYELCAAGGLAWVRRTSRLGSAPSVTESDPASFSRAEALWEKLLNGAAA